MNSLYYEEKGYQHKQAHGRGRNKMIMRSELLDADKGFIKNDTIVIEASLDVYRKKSTTMLK